MFECSACACRIANGLRLLARVADVDGDVAVASGQGTESVDALDGSLGGEVERRGAATRGDFDVRWGAVAVDRELEDGTLAAGLGAVGLLLLGAEDGLVDELDVIGETVAEGALFDRNGGGAVLRLEDGLRDLDAGGLARGGLGRGGCGRSAGGGCGSCGRLDGGWFSGGGLLGGGFTAAGFAGSGLLRIRTSFGLGGGSALGGTGALAFGSGGAGVGGGGAMLGFSEVRTSSALKRCLGGSGSEETAETCMAPASGSRSPQWMLALWDR